MSAAAAPHQEESFQPVAAVLAFLLPGLGHVWLGEVRRGLLIGAGVIGLFLGGLLIGGIDIIDRHTDKWWFFLQAGNGPMAFVTDAVNRNMQASSVNGEARPIVSIGRVKEAGILYAALGGMLNTMVVVDAAWHLPRGSNRRRRGGEGRLI